MKRRLAVAVAAVTMVTASSALAASTSTSEVWFESTNHAAHNIQQRWGTVTYVRCAPVRDSGSIVRGYTRYWHILFCIGAEGRHLFMLRYHPLSRGNWTITNFVTGMTVAEMARKSPATLA